MKPTRPPLSFGIGLLIGLLTLLAGAGIARAQADDAPKLTPKDQEALAKEKEVQERFREFERSVESLAKSIEKEDPNKAKRLRAAFARAQKRGISEMLDAIVGQLEGRSLDLAHAGQRKVAGELANLLEFLLESFGPDLDKSRAERDDLEEYLRRIEKLRKAQEQNLGQTQDPELADPAPKQGEPATPPQAPKTPPATKDLRDREGEMKGRAADLAKPGPLSTRSLPPGERKNAPPPPKAPSAEPRPGADSLERAAGAMKDATGKLGANDRPGSVPPQKRALEELKKAEGAARDALKEKNQEHKEKLLNELERLIEAMLKRQRPLNAKTTKLDATKDTFEPRVLGDHARGIAREEDDVRSLDGELMKLLDREDLGESTLKSNAEVIEYDLKQIIKRLQASNPGFRTQRLQTEVVQLLEAMLEAVRDARKAMENPPESDPNDDNNQNPNGDDNGDQQQQEPPLIPDEADLKMIRALQKNLLDLTLAFDSRRGETLSTEDKSIAKDLRDRQLFVAKLLRKVIDAEGHQD